jgi:hypothetical protein
MKLVDILARELEFWPDNNLEETAASFIAQDSDGMIVTLDPEETASASQFNQTDWSRSHWTGGDLVFEVAEDHRAAIITRTQWQAAVDAMKAESPTLHLQEVGRITRVPSWSGLKDDLPSAGVVCEVLNSGLHNPVWEKCIILFCGKHRVLYDSESCSERCGHIEDLEFRPIRTPEQIAADDRQKGIEELGNFLAATSNTPTPYLWEAAQKIYDAGYRKTSTTDN